MKICIAQTRAIKGNIQGNIEKHKEFIDTAVSHHTDLIIFDNTAQKTTIIKK